MPMLLPLAVLLRYLAPELLGLGAGGLSQLARGTGYPDVARGLDYPAQLSLLYQLLERSGTAPTPEGGAGAMTKMLLPGLGMGAAHYWPGMSKIPPGMLGKVGMTAYGLAPIPLAMMGGEEPAAPQADDTQVPAPQTGQQGGGPGRQRTVGQLSNEELLGMYGSQRADRNAETEMRYALANIMGSPEQYMAPGRELMAQTGYELAAAPGQMAALYEALAQSSRLGGRGRRRQGE